MILKQMKKYYFFFIIKYFNNNFTFIPHQKYHQTIHIKKIDLNKHIYIFFLPNISSVLLTTNFKASIA